MPGGGSDSDSDRGEDYKEEKNLSRESSRQNARQSTKGGQPDDDDDDQPQWNTRGEQPTGGGGADPPIPENEQWTNKLNILMLVTLGLSWLLLIIITATQSWGVGKILEDKDAKGSAKQGTGMTAGLFEVCDADACYKWDSGPAPRNPNAKDGFCADGAGLVTATFACCIISIVWLLVMLIVQIMIKVKGQNCPPTLPKCQCCLGHVLWLLLMLDWVFWAANHNGAKCFSDTWDSTLYYSWGWMFVLWMWLVHLVTAILVTMKVKGKQLPCAM